MKIFLRPLVEDVGFSRIRNRVEFYSASFGQKDDARQWADYADGGKGVALGPAPKFFSLAKKEDFKPEEEIFLGKVEYGEPTAKMRHAAIVDSAAETIKQAHKQGLLLKPEDEEAFLHLMAAYMYVEILWNSVTTKSDKWSHQIETRLLAVNDLNNPRIEIKNAQARPRVEIPQPLLKRRFNSIALCSAPSLVLNSVFSRPSISRAKPDFGGSIVRPVGIHRSWRQIAHLVTVSPARPTSLFRRLWKE